MAFLKLFGGNLSGSFVECCPQWKQPILCVTQLYQWHAALCVVSVSNVQLDAVKQLLSFLI